MSANNKLPVNQKGGKSLQYLIFTPSTDSVYRGKEGNRG
jgi:hypothetical protein